MSHPCLPSVLNGGMPAPLVTARIDASGALVLSRSVTIELSAPARSERLRVVHDVRAFLGHWTEPGWFVDLEARGTPWTQIAGPFAEYGEAVEAALRRWNLAAQTMEACCAASDDEQA